MTTIIIIPYRNREEHLKYFIDNSVSLLKKYMERTNQVREDIDVVPKCKRIMDIINCN